MIDPYFARKAEEIYGETAVEQTKTHFGGDEAIVEVFFALSAQIDMLVEEGDVNVWEAQFRDLGDDDWSFERILDAADEIARLAHIQKVGVWPMIASVAAAMRAMSRTVRIMPSESFEAKASEKTPPGLAAILDRDDLRPLDLVVASVAEDLGPGTATAAAVAAEREACLALVRAQIEKALGEDVTLESLETQQDDLHDRLAELEGKLDECRDGQVAAVESEIKDAETALQGLEFRTHAGELLDEVRKAIEARRPPEPEDASSPGPEPTTTGEP